LLSNLPHSVSEAYSTSHATDIRDKVCQLGKRGAANLNLNVLLVTRVHSANISACHLQRVTNRKLQAELIQPTCLLCI